MFKTINRSPVIAVVIYSAVFLIHTFTGIANEYVFKHLGLEEGLSQTTISVIFQDSKGFLWFGTSNGLNRYDGYSFVVYTNDPFDSGSISDNGISAVYEDLRGNLWIGTNNGVLNKFVREEEKFIRYPLEDTLKAYLPPGDQYYEYPITFSRNNNSTVTSITQDKNGNLWIGTFGHGLKAFDINARRVKHFYNRPEETNSISYNRITDLYCDRNDYLWIGTFGGGLNRVDLTNLKEGDLQADRIIGKRDKDERFYGDKILTIMEDSDSNLWFGTYTEGLKKIDKSAKYLSVSEMDMLNYRTERGVRNSLCNNTVMALAQDNKGDIWIATFGGGLDKFDPKMNRFSHFVNDPSNPNSLSDNDVISLHFDFAGILWIGTHLGEGIDRLEEKKIKFESIKKSDGEQTGLNDDVVWAVLEDSRKNLWVGTYRGGLNKIDHATKKTRIFAAGEGNDGIRDNHIRSLAEDKYGNIWVGTYSGGLYRYNDRSGRFVNFNQLWSGENTFGSNQIQVIRISEDGTYWIGTFGGGLAEFTYNPISEQPENLKIFSHIPGDENSLSDNRVYSMFEDGDRIWIGTFGGGLNVFHKSKERFESFLNDPEDDESLSDNRVMTVYKDKYDRLWLGTYGGGLNLFDENKKMFFKYSEKSGLYSDVVYAILEDDNGNLWLSTDNGIFKFNYSEDSFIQYDLQDGLQSLEFSGGAYTRSREGVFYFGGIKGINYFNPDSIQHNPFIPPVVISAFKVFNEPYPTDFSSIDLRFDQNFFSFEFSALDFSNPSDNNYAYILEGFNREWQFVEATRRIANYTNVPPGKYTFRAIGSNNDNIWNTDGVSVSLVVNPPFWRTWWFITAALFLSVLLIYYIGTIRYKNLLAIERLKTKLAADLHDNIGSGLTEISILSELTARSPGDLERNDHLNNISNKARDLIDNMSDIVWMVNPQKDSFHELIVRLKQNYGELLMNLGITFKAHNIEAFKTFKLPMDYKQNLFLILKEGLNNAIKHSKCRTIVLESNISSSLIEIKLRDDGIGLPDSFDMIGNGIRNILRRAAEIGGEVNFGNGENGGTVLHFKGRITKRNKLQSFFQEIK